MIEASTKRVEVKIPLGFRTRNHLKSMYFGALSVGADLAAGYLALARIQQANRPVSFVFQAVKGEFLRRPTGDVHFICEDGAAVERIVEQTLVDGERHATTVVVNCVVPTESDASVARFEMTLSVKAKSR